MEERWGRTKDDWYLWRSQIERNRRVNLAQEEMLSVGYFLRDHSKSVRKMLLQLFFTSRNESLIIEILTSIRGTERCTQFIFS
jgi:hypothetical protein